MATSRSKTSSKKSPVTKQVAPTVNKLIAANFLKAFEAQVSAAERAGLKPADVNAIVQSMCGFAQNRKAGEIKIRAYNPDLGASGGQATHTIIEIINDDMAFIVDSVSAALAHQNLQVESLFHPIVGVNRAKDAMTDVSPVKAWAPGFMAESWIFVRLEQMLSSEAMRQLEERLQANLRDVRAATSDWKAMLEKLETITTQSAEFSKGASKEDSDEAAAFLRYIKVNNFTLLGYREISFTGKGTVKAELGVLKGNKDVQFGESATAPEAVALAASRWPVMITKLIDHDATVHRRVPMDAVCVKVLDKNGKLSGMHVFVGLFTSSTYSCRTSDVPIVRQKVKETIDRCGFVKGAHDHKALEHILEKMPRDGLFHISVDDLYTMSLGILRLQAKQRIALFTHVDPAGRYISCLVYVPRDRYNTKFRLQAAKIIEQATTGKVTNYFTTLDDSALARLLFTVRLEDARLKFDAEAAEHKLVELGREWDERLKQVMIEVFGKIKGADLAHTYGRAFTSAYHESLADIKNAVHDIRQLEALRHSAENISVDFYRLSDAPQGEYRLKVYHNSEPVPLSDILPELANMGLRAVSEMPYEVTPQGSDKSIWIHDFELLGAPNIDIDAVKASFEDAFVEVWKDTAEDDGLNALVLKASLTWREVTILRTYSGYMRQARFPYSRTYVEQVLGLYPAIARELVALFTAMHDPKGPKQGKKQSENILTLLQEVQKLDHDRILRSFMTLIQRTLRTSYYQTDANGLPKPHLAIKLDSKNIPDLPLPKPYVEIFVYSARVEAVHLRNGEIARGGIRWSDRHDDFRTEILGLLKSQQVKNTVIVPVGAKGGFVVKQPPKTGGREAYAAEGIECYKIFVQALLDLTDNNVKGKIVRPKDVVCHDDIDPYLVVAADKGTATFSDIANSLSLNAGFWLGDAFASGGGTGYDHKKIAITARGGWESVKRHFREIGKDIQKEPFTLVGVGDMAGDVFGNAMLLSTQMRLLGAFNHVHIMCDPNPDIAGSFAERERMFKARAGWDQYDKTKLSAGGAIFERSAKTLKLSPQIRKCFEIEAESVTPDELIRAILKAKVELLWFGGIGTFLKSSKQSHADADDKSNDNLRIDANELRVKVVGEGANLGSTQLARIEFARLGGRINTDFIDNSGGVDCSDHEVNIKILLADVVARKKLTTETRNKLLVKMTEEVSALVLRDNYQQTQSLSLQTFLAKDHIGMHADFVKSMEKAGLIKRSLEGLPDEEGFARLAREGAGLTRPELCILTSYSKIVIYNQILASNIPDDASMEGLLFEYFPKELQKYKDEIRNHKLRREIIATQIVNMLVNRMGPVFVQSRVEKTGASPEDVIKAFMIVEGAFGLGGLWKMVEDLDNKIPAQVQMTAFHELFQTVKRAVTWFLRSSGKLDIAQSIELYGEGMGQLRKTVGKILPASLRALLKGSVEQLISWSVPPKMAEEIAAIKLLSSACDIISIARKNKGDLSTVATTYFDMGDKMGFDWLRTQVSDLTTDNRWQARVKSGILDDLYHHQAALVAKKIKASDLQIMAAKSDVLVGELRAQEKVTLEMLVLVSQRLGQLVNGSV